MLGIKRIDHVSVVNSDLDGRIKFYSDLFGMEVAERFENVSCSVGIHPHEAAAEPEEEIDEEEAAMRAHFRAAQEKRIRGPGGKFVSKNPKPEPVDDDLDDAPTPPAEAAGDQPAATA